MSTVIEPKEREALKEFRVRIADIIENLNEYKRHDLWLLRWLRARELNINKSEEMLRKSLEWRAKENMDTILDWKVPEAIDQALKMKVCGFDKDGCVIAVIPFGRWDVKNLVQRGMKADFIRFVDLMFEQSNRFAEHRSTKDGMITQFVLILDFEEFSLKQVTSKETIDTLLEAVRRFEANHPETLKAAWVVNAPKIFELLFAVVKPLLSARTMSKVHVHGSNQDQWRKKLLENINPDELPSQYGGTNTSSKDYKVIYGFDIFYLNESFPPGELMEATVEAGVKHVVTFSLNPGNKLSWNFRTVDYDIGFALLYSGTTGSADPTVNAVVIFESARADSHIHVQKGQYVADKAGTYCLVFDNSFSRLRKKSLFFAARVV